MLPLLKTMIRMTALLLVIGVTMGSIGDLPAQAKKKAAAVAVDPAVTAAAEMQKALEPINQSLTKLMMRLEGRALLSPEEAGQLVEIKYKLMDMYNQNPQSAQLAKPIFQAGMLFADREEYSDAYEMYNYLVQSFPVSHYGLKAQGQMKLLEKRFGADYFATAAIAPPATPDAAGTATASATPQPSPTTGKTPKK